MVMYRGPPLYSIVTSRSRSPETMVKVIEPSLPLVAMRSASRARHHVPPIAMIFMRGEAGLYRQARAEDDRAVAVAKRDAERVTRRAGRCASGSGRWGSVYWIE